MILVKIVAYNMGPQTPLVPSNRNSMFLDELDLKVTEGSKGPSVILVKITYNMGV